MAAIQGGRQFAAWLKFWMQKGVLIAAEKRKERRQIVAGDCRLCGPRIIPHNFSDAMFHCLDCVP